jgi:triacylglycerol esterase/lipase EstA (alpha/beta hydrolase family)
MNAAVRAFRILNWWVRDYAYALYWQARSTLSRQAAETFSTGDRTPIVIVPGVYETWRFLQPLITTLHDRGHPVHVVDPLERNSKPVAQAAEQVTAYLEKHDLRGVVLVAHSKGGLVGKYVMSLGRGAARVDSMLAIAAPFGGSWYARLMVAPSLRIFRPMDATIVALAQQLNVNARIVSVYGQFDPHIPRGSELVGAKNVELDTGGHFRILANPRVVGELVALVE